MKRIAISIAALALAACSPSDNETAQSGDDWATAQATAASLYDAFAAGNMDRIAALLGDDVQWVEAEGGPYEAGNPYVGVEGVGAGVFGPIGESYEGFAATPERYTTEGNRVVVEGRYTGTHRETGETLDAQFVHVYTIDGETIEAMQQYTDTYQWRAVEGSLGN
ncbi:nuclear transport factor 2 family protein [Qipengyuania nanhaisediminis]|uniref:nuclear transport factor 2 family protein n=1 Tax=Qipengyuania nanhaisediminis TaxID=604088 RepID=UPI0038B32008